MTSSKLSVPQGGPYRRLTVILTTATEIEFWMTAPAEQALKLQRPLPDGTLKIVMTGEKEDPAA